MARPAKRSLGRALKGIAWIVVAALFLSALSLGLNFWVYRELQARLKIQLAGDYIPSLFIPSFEVRQGSFVWDDRVQLVDGNFKVTFDPLTLISQRGIRVILKSRASKIRFLGSWALQQGLEAATVDSLVADVVLGRRGLAAVNEVEVKSQTFQFSLKNADKKITQEPSRSL